MKSIVAGVVAGLAIGWTATADHYRSKIAATEQQQKEVQDAYNAAIIRTSEYWKNELDAVNDRPVPAPERVYVKASCVPDSRDTGMGEGAGAARYRLADTTVQSVAGVAKEFQDLYHKCSHQLAFYKEAFGSLKDE